MSGTRIPDHIDRLKPYLPRFRGWLSEHGAGIHAPTNLYEVMRFDTPEGVGVIYSKSNGRLTFVGGALTALSAFLHNSEWRACEKTNLTRAKQRRTNLVRSVAERDGWTCCFCGGPLTAASATLEHFVSRTHGGPDHLANLILAHSECNSRASHLSTRGKIELAVSMRGATP